MDQGKSVRNSLAIIGLVALAAVGAWQFYLFAAFSDAVRGGDVQGGTIHLWVAIGIALIVCIGGFFVISRLVRYDSQNEIHITSPGQPAGAGSIEKTVL